MTDEIRANDPAERELIDPEVEVTIDTRMITDGIHCIMHDAHEKLNRLEAEIAERVIRSIRVRCKAERSYRLTMDAS